MAELTVMFDVPAAIAQGLKNGTLERVGGVIRNVGDKQIVMWLQEGVLLERDTAEQLLRQGGEQVQLLQQQAEQLSQLGVQQQMMMGLQVANLAVSVIGFALVLHKLHGIESQLKSMDRKLDSIQQGVGWLDVKQMIEKLAPVHASLSHLREADLYSNPALMQQQLLMASSQLTESHSYFGGLLQHVSENNLEYAQPGEFAAAYRSWVMSAQGRAQVLARMGEMKLAIQVASEFKDKHAAFGKRLQQTLQNPGRRLEAGLQADASHAQLLTIAQQSVGAHEIIRGNVLQLEFLRDEGLELPRITVPEGYQGLVLCSVN